VSGSVYTRRICDTCGKVVDKPQHNDRIYGPDAFEGWLHVQRVPMTGEKDRKIQALDFCGDPCLLDYFDPPEEVKE
jgi:hypothetical protein